MQNPNKKVKSGPTISDITKEKISTSKKTGYGMYVITFKVGSKKHAQTRHMTEKQAEAYEPRIEVVQSGGRTLQKSSFQIA